MDEENENRKFIILFIFVGILLTFTTNIIIMMMLFSDRAYNVEINEYQTKQIIHEIRK